MTTAHSMSAALTLTSVLQCEGYHALWARTDRGEYKVFTNAPAAALLACVASANTMMGARS